MQGMIWGLGALDPMPIRDLPVSQIRYKIMLIWRYIDV